MEKELPIIHHAYRRRAAASVRDYDGTINAGKKEVLSMANTLMETIQQHSYEVELEASESGNAVSSVCRKDGKSAETKRKSGGWGCARLLLVCEGFAALAATGVEVNLVLFAKTVLRQSNADAATMFTKWMGTLNIFALIGAFLSDSYMGSYLTSTVFQIVLVLGLAILSVSTHLFMLEPKGCGRIGELCNSKSFVEFLVFYLSIYLLALGSGAMEPALATFGADQFDDDEDDDDDEKGSQGKQSKTLFFSYYYVALNIGSLMGETVLVYLQSLGMWELAFWISTSCGFFSLFLLICGRNKFRRLKPSGNPISRFSHVLVASVRKFNLKLPSNGEGLYECQVIDQHNARKMPHTDDFRFLDRAALVTATDDMRFSLQYGETPNPWRLCTVTQVEEVKCLLRILPIWFCTVLASVVFVQVFSLFVEQGAAMNTLIWGFRMPPASMTIFDIVSTSTFIICYDRLLVPLYIRVRHKKPKPINELQRIGIGLVIAIIAMTIAGFVEQQRLRFADQSVKETSSLSIFWQIPQYVLVGVAEAFMIVAEWEFFTSQTPESLKCLGLGLSMSSSAFGSYLCGVMLTVTMKITTKHGKPGWVPPNLNDGHLDRFFFLSAALTALALLLFTVAAKRYKGITVEKQDESAQNPMQTKMAARTEAKKDDDYTSLHSNNA